MKLSGEDVEVKPTNRSHYGDVVVHFKKPTNFLQEKLPQKVNNEPCIKFGAVKPIKQADELRYPEKEPKRSFETLCGSKEGLSSFTKEVSCVTKEVSLHENATKQLSKPTTDAKNLSENIKVSTEKFASPVDKLNFSNKELIFQTHKRIIGSPGKSQSLNKNHLSVTSQKKINYPNHFEITNKNLKDTTEIKLEDSFKTSENKEVSNMANVMELIKSKYLSKCRVESSYTKLPSKESTKKDVSGNSNTVQKSNIPEKSNVSSILKPNSESQRFLDLLELASGKKPASGHSFLKDRIYSLTKRATRSKYRSHHGSHFGGLGVKNVVKKVETKYKDAKKETTEKRFYAKTPLSSQNSSCLMTPINSMTGKLDKATEVKKPKQDDYFLESKASRFSLKSVALSIIQKLKESGNEKVSKSNKKHRKEKQLPSDLAFGEHFDSPEPPKSPPFVPYIFRGTGTFVVTGSRGMIYDFNDHDNVFEEYIKSFDEFHNDKAENQLISPLLRRKNTKQVTKPKLLPDSVGSPTISFYFDFQEPIISDHISPVCKDVNSESFESDEQTKKQTESLNRKNPQNQKKFISSKSLCFRYSNVSTPSAISKCHTGNLNDYSGNSMNFVVKSLDSPVLQTVEPKNAELGTTEASQLQSGTFESKFYTLIGNSAQGENELLSPSMCVDIETCSNSDKAGELSDNSMLKKTYYLHKFAPQRAKCDKVANLKTIQNYSLMQSQEPNVQLNVAPCPGRATTKPILKSVLRKPPNLTICGVNPLERRHSDSKSDSINLLSPTKICKKENYSKTNKAKMNRNKKVKELIKCNITNSNNKINKGYDFSGFFSDLDNKVKITEKLQNNKSAFSVDTEAAISSHNKPFNNDKTDLVGGNKDYASNVETKLNLSLENVFNEKEIKDKREGHLPKTSHGFIKESELLNDSINLRVKDQILRGQLNEQPTDITDINIPGTPKVQMPEKKESKEVGKLLAEINDLVCRISEEANAGSNSSKINAETPKRYSARFSNAFTEKFLSSNVEFRKSQLSKNSQSLPVIVTKCDKDESKEGINSYTKNLKTFKTNDNSVKVALQNLTAKDMPFNIKMNQINEESVSKVSNHLDESRQDRSLKIDRVKNSKITNSIPETFQKENNYSCDYLTAGQKCLESKLLNPIEELTNKTVTYSTTLGSSKATIFKSTAELSLHSSINSKTKLESFGQEKLNTRETFKNVLKDEETSKADKPDFVKSSIADDRNKFNYKQTLMEIQKLMPTRERNIPIQGGHVESKANDYLKAVQKSFGTTNDIQLLKKNNKSNVPTKLQSNLTTIQNHHELVIADRKRIFRTTKYLAPLKYDNETNEIDWCSSVEQSEQISNASSSDVNEKQLLYERKNESIKNDGRFYDENATYSETQTPLAANEALNETVLLLRTEKENYVSNKGCLDSQKGGNETEKRSYDEVSSNYVHDLKRQCYENQNKNETTEKLKDSVEESSSSNHINSDGKGDQSESIDVEVETSSYVEEKIRNAALVDAVLKNNVSLVRKFLNLKSDPNAKCGSAGGTVLHKAASRGYFEILQELLLAGANTECRTGYGNTPLHFAAEKGHANIVSELLSKGANVNATTSYGITPLQLSLALGYLDINVILMQHQADFFKPNMVGETSEYIADSLGYDSEYLQSILYNSSFEETEPSEVPLSVQLIRGVEEGCPITVERCLKNGANPDTPVPLALHWPAQATVLHRAAHKGDDLLIQLLLRAGSSVNARDIVGNTPLHAGAQRGCNRVVKLLIESGSDLEATSRKGMTPLHRAASKGKDHTVRLLLKYGASYLATDENGRTPSDWAHKRGFKTLAKHLQLQSQSSAESLNNSRKSTFVDPVDQAKKPSSEDTAIK